MPCYFPLKAYQTQDKSIVFSEKKGMNITRSLSLPCNQCVGCRLERSRQWAVRCMHEASLHTENSFITLTYNDQNVPSDYSLKYRDFQLFMKRLRKDVGPVRFYMCGEYGEEFKRPHFHAVIFGYDFKDKTPWTKTPSGSMIYRSKILESLWPYGYSSIGDVNFQSAAYVARYVMKKVTGKQSSEHYMLIDSSTGEVFNRKPEFNKMSLKPGIGANWIDKHIKDVYPHDFVVVNGKKVRPPKYYDKKFKKLDESSFEDIQFARELLAKKNVLDNTPERLIVKAQVVKDSLTTLKRNLK